MTATGYNAVTDSELEPGKPLTTGLAFRFRDNPLALAQRGAGAPWLNGIGAVDQFTITGGSQTFTWTVPAGVYHAEFIIIGGGADHSGDNSGEASSVSGIGSAQGGSYNGGYPPEYWVSDNGGQANFFVSAAKFTSRGPGGLINIIKAAVTPGATHTVTVGKGGGRGLTGWSSGNGGHGTVIIRY